MKFIKGDNVLVTAGKDKGKKGKIEKIFPDEARVLVHGVNSFKRHTKKRDEKNPGGIIEHFRPLPVGNIALVCPSCGKPTRVGYLMTKNEKMRICRKCGQKI